MLLKCSLNLDSFVTFFRWQDIQWNMLSHKLTMAITVLQVTLNITENKIAQVTQK